jgi:hypothetical protein
MLGTVLRYSLGKRERCYGKQIKGTRIDYGVKTFNLYYILYNSGKKEENEVLRSS